MNFLAFGFNALSMPFHHQVQSVLKALFNNSESSLFPLTPAPLPEGEGTHEPSPRGRGWPKAG